MDKDLIHKQLQKHTIVDGTTGCWLWTGSLSKGGKSEGYGRIAIRRTVYYVHRLSAYIYLDMPISKNIDRYTKNYQALHKCANKNCWNPDHLYVGTHGDNMNDRDGG